MALEPGTPFGSYEVGEPIGAGGMGEVYLARDTNLKREVALKVLPPAFVEDADRLARFQREAEILASLNNPNIAQVYGLERSDGQTAIAMELVEGPTLADRIAEGPIAPDEAMGIALQIVAALEAAHEKQIVHRDLKPANIKVRDDGTVKVLDFGISKPLDPAAISGGSPVATTPAATQTGVILGTAAYMSPEQARGKFVDQRTDIWAFGCLLFEMLTGQPAFGGEDVMLTLARVLANETNLDSIPGTISPAVRHTIKLCLEKDPRKRIADIRDVRLALSGSFESLQPSALQSQARVSSSQRLVPVAATAIVTTLIAAAAVIWALQSQTESEPGPLRRFAYQLPTGQEIDWGIQRNSIAISPDGTGFVYTTRQGMFWRAFDSLESQPIPGTIMGELSAPFFLPTDQRIAFGGPVNSLYRIPLEGGVAEPVDISGWSGGTQTFRPNADGSFLVGHVGGISQADALGSALRLLIEIEPDLGARNATLLPNQDTVLFTEYDPEIGRESARVVAQVMSSGERRELIPRAFDARYLPTGHLLWARDGAVWARSFDADDLSFSGDGVEILSGVRMPSRSWRADYDVAADGTLVYLQDPGLIGTGSGDHPYVWAYFDGRVEEFPINVPEEFDWPKISPDGARLAVTRRFPGQGADIWVYELARPDSPIRVTSDGVSSIRPFWTPDGRSLVFVRSVYPGGPLGIYRIAADGAGEPELLWGAPDFVSDIFPNWVNIEQTELLFHMFRSDRIQGDAEPDVNDFLIDGGIFRLRLEAGASPERVLDDPGIAEGFAAVSPTGRTLAYATETVAIEREIRVRPYPEVDSGRFPPISGTNGGQFPIWDPTGESLYYLDRDSRQIMAIEVEFDPEFRRGDPMPVTGPVARTVSGYFWPLYDIDFGRGRVLMRRAEDAPDRSEVNAIFIVQNWYEELRRLVPVD